METCAVYSRGALAHRKEFLQSLQTRQKCNDKRRNFEVGDIVILEEQDYQRNQWPLARIIGVDADKNGDVGSFTLRVPDSNNGNQTLRRPTTKGHFVNQHPTSRQTSHIPHPTSQTSHIPHIPHPQHPTS